MILVDPIHGTTDRISWGWVAVIYGVCPGRWVHTEEASEVTGLSPAALKRWAERGVISQIAGSKRKYNAYLHSELKVVERIVRQAPQSDGAPSLRIVKAHIEDVIYNGFR